MNQIALALAGLVCGLVLLGAATADWSTTVAQTEFTTDDLDGATETSEDPAIVIERREATNGAEVAGALVPIALAGMLGSLVAFRVAWAGAAIALLGTAGAVTAVGGLGRAPGTLTQAPTMALASATVMVVTGGLLVVLARRGGADATPSREAPPSRYTVEAVRGEVAGPADEWDLAVAEELPADQTHPDRTEDQT